MKFIRHIIIALAFIAAFIVITIFSSTEYSSDKIDINATEDRLPAVKVVFSTLGHLLTYADKIPMLNFLPVAKIGAGYELKASQNIYNNIKDNITEDYDFKGDTGSQTPILAISPTKTFNWSEIISSLKEALSKDWFRP